MITITIWHNTAKGPSGLGTAMVFGHEDGDRLVPVAVYSVDDTVVASDARSVADDLAEDAFRLFNVGDDPDFGVPDQRALEYRARGNRSLSVGDVVQVGATWLAVAGTGFGYLSDAPSGLATDAEPDDGTTRSRYRRPAVPLQPTLGLQPRDRRWRQYHARTPISLAC